MAAASSPRLGARLRRRTRDAGESDSDALSPDESSFTFRGSALACSGSASPLAPTCSGLSDAADQRAGSASTNPIEQFAAGVLARAVLSRQSTADLSADLQQLEAKQVSELIAETISEVSSPKEDGEVDMLLSGESGFTPVVPAPAALPAALTPPSVPRSTTMTPLAPFTPAAVLTASDDDEEEATLALDGGEASDDDEEEDEAALAAEEAALEAEEARLLAEELAALEEEEAELLRLEAEEAQIERVLTLTLALALALTLTSPSPSLYPDRRYCPAERSSVILTSLTTSSASTPSCIWAHG